MDYASEAKQHYAEGRRLLLEHDPRQASARFLAASAAAALAALPEPEPEDGLERIEPGRLIAGGGTAGAAVARFWRR